ncbi:MAG: DUF1501 domain-containing protein [Planctomycetota bacterium]
MTDPHQPYTRRRFLERGLIFASAAATVPTFLHRSASSVFAQTSSATSSIPGVPEDRILVVVQLAGGNDGLNTLIPARNDEYYRVRPQIAVPRDEVLTLERSADVGLHPALDGFKSLYEDGMLSIVQGVGYPNPNRSHFASMDIWHTADTSGVGDGWIGKFFDNECAGTPDGCGDGGIAIGREAPLAMQGRAFQPITFEDPNLFRWIGEDLSGETADAYHELMDAEQMLEHPEGSNADFLTRTTLDAQVSSQRIREAVEQRPLVNYPGFNLAQQLRQIGAMIRAGLATRVYYATIGGFDTHAGQGGANGRHAQLLGQVAQAINTFYADLKAQRNDGRVLTVCFSEFGRRVGQNYSGGTDHGTAAPMFLAGPMVRPGLLGRYPSLNDLDNGDLKFTTDFRSVYASVLEDWLGLRRHDTVLGSRYRKAKVLSV